MSVHLTGRSFLTLKDFTPEEIAYLIQYAADLKKQHKEGKKEKRLEGKSIALIFQKPSTRTRSAFSVSCIQEGGYSEYLGKGDIHLGEKETIADTAKVLGRMFDGIGFRGFEQEMAEELAENAKIPVWNGLTDQFHPTQILADLLTLQEKAGPVKNVRLAYMGDGRNNVANSLLIGSAKMGLDLRIVAPKELSPPQELLDYAIETAKQNGGRILITDDPEEGVKDVDAIYTDVWVSMGEKGQFEKKIELLKPYQVNQELLNKTGNENVIFMHCLPAFHNPETSVGKEIQDTFGLNEMEVTDEVFHSKHSVVFDQAENRLHTIKAILLATLL
jgi:ornithine carbamoyltransferase